MKEYDFTLKYRLGRPNEDAGKHLEALAESGCEDAVVGVGQNGRISYVTPLLRSLDLCSYQLHVEAVCRDSQDSSAYSRYW